MRNHKVLLMILLMVSSTNLIAQVNCYLYEEGSDCFKACRETEKAMTNYSGDLKFQKSLLKAIELCPTFDMAYFELSVNYAKRGMLPEWKKLIDQAVEISPERHLGWRGWYHWFFAHNYEKAIADIDSLDTLVDYDLGTTGDGKYHLNILKGLCYKGLGDSKKALQIIERCMNDPEYYQGVYDYLHLGVLYLEMNQPEKALAALETQNAYDEISEAYFYSAKAHLLAGNKAKAKDFLNTALEMYDIGKAMYDPYREFPDEIYRVDILELQSGL